MKYLILISVLFLTACGSRVTSGEIAKARMYCSDKGGVRVAANIPSSLLQ